MTGFGVIVADCPWRFGDKLKQSDVKRGSEAHYATMSVEEIEALTVATITAHDALLALWCPKTMLQDGLGVMTAWGFGYKTQFTWRKTTKTGKPHFGMGRTFRASEEIALIGTRGSVVKHVADHSQRDHCYAPVPKHSAKPDDLQHSLDLMFPDWQKLELFARRDLDNWNCTGLECPSTLDEDVHYTITRLRQEIECQPASQTAK